MRLVGIYFYEAFEKSRKIVPYPNEEKWKGELEEILRKKKEAGKRGWWEWEKKLRETMYKMLTEIIGREEEEEPIFSTPIPDFDENDKHFVITKACFIERWDGNEKKVWGVILKIKERW